MNAQKKYERIEWSDSFSSGLVYLDNHRRNFIDIVNELVEIVNEETCGSSLPMIFHRLAFYVEEYFINKEIALMGNSELPLQHYKEEHEKFINEVGKFHNQFRKGQEGVCAELLKFVTAWFENYIQMFGPEAVDYMRSRGFE